MRRSLTATVLSVAVLVGCSGGDSTEPSRPTAIEIVSAASQSATAGLAVPQTPSFLIKDQHGQAMGGVPVTVAVTAGGGTIANAPSQSLAGPTPVGTWTLGPLVGSNQLTISAGSLTATVTATGAAGAAAKIAVLGSPTLSGRVATEIAPGPTGRVTDQFDNPVAGVTVIVSVSGDATAPASVVTDTDGRATVPSWRLGTTRGTYTLTLAVGSASATFTATALSGPPAAMSIVSGDGQIARAGTQLAAPPVIGIRDQFGNGVENQEVAFTVTAGGGSLAQNTAVSDLNGHVSAPAWTLGKSAIPQTVRAEVGALAIDISAQVQTAYAIEVRFVGAMDDQNLGLFANAAARLRAIVIGDVPDVNIAPPVDLGVCGSWLSGQTFSGLIDDVVIYTTVRTMDGPGQILGSAGPCYIRSGGGLPLIGVMSFDEADIGNLAANGTLQDVITHEMLHVLGIGSMWGTRALISPADNTYVGVQARQACVEVGGAGVCATSVPAENSGGPGTVNVHWRESVFDHELMTGFAESGAMPLSLITISGLEDLVYEVNRNALDEYRIPGTLRAARSRVGAGLAQTTSRDEVLLPVGLIHRNGRVEIVRPADRK